MPSKNVTINQEYLRDYRTLFYQKLHFKLAEQDINLNLIYSPEVSHLKAQQELTWATPLNSYRAGYLTWQPVFARSWASDLIITPQLVRYPASLLLQFTRGLSGRRHAFWGHGSSDKSKFAHNATQTCKRIMSTRADWWFAYNDLAAARVEKLGYPQERITSVMNAIDTAGIKKRRETITSDEIHATRLELGICGDNIAVYTGSLCNYKRPQFLVDACKKIRDLVPDFEIIIIGDGPDTGIIEKAAKEWRWFHYLGRKNDMEKVPYWAISKLLLMPGGVGLVALDSLALGIPMVTTENRFHGPEIDYIRDEITGLIVKVGDDPAVYAAEVAALLRDDSRREKMATNALEDGERYSIEDMSQRFADGIMQALEAPRYRVFF